MSSKPHSSFVVEWSPRSLVGYDSTTKTTRTFASAAEVAGVAREVIVAVSRRSVFIRSVRVPDVSPEEIRQVLALRLDDLFPVATSDLAIDFQLTNDVTSEGRLAMVAAMPTAELGRLYNDFRSAGVRIARVVPAALSSALIDAVGSEPSAVVQETTEGFAIDIVADGVVRQSRVTSVPQQIQAEVCRTFSMSGLECGTIVSAGGLALPFAEVVVKDNGLSLLQHFQDRLSINLELPDEVSARVKRARANKQRQALLLMVAAACLGLYVFFDYNDSIVALRAAEAKGKVALQKQEKEQKALEAELAALSVQQTDLTRAYHPAQRFSDVMTLLSNRTPQGVWLTGITIERGKTISVRGTATSNEALTAYLKALSGEPRLRDVRLVFANNSEIEEIPVVQFSLSGFPVGNVPLVENTRGSRR